MAEHTIVLWFAKFLKFLKNGKVRSTGFGLFIHQATDDIDLRIKVNSENNRLVIQKRPMRVLMDEAA